MLSETISPAEVIQDYLQLFFEQVPRPERVCWLVDRFEEAVSNGEFNPQLSRAIVFVTARRRAEEIAQALQQHFKERNLGLAVEAFHAELPGEVRKERYEQYREGSLHVLVATKAFGLGMDIPNIHLVIHYDPPTSLEDYIQEIGRAGRDPKARLQAGFDNSRRVPCVLLWDDEDLGRSRDRLRQQLVSWHDVTQVFDAIKAYAKAVKHISATGQPSNKPLYIPTNLLAHERNGAQKLDMGMYWLERAGRMKVCYVVPGLLYIRRLVDKPQEEDRKIVALLDLITGKQWGDEAVALTTNELLHELEIDDIPELFDFLAQVEGKGYIQVLHWIRIRFTGSWLKEVVEALASGSVVPRLRAGTDILKMIVRKASSSQTNLLKLSRDEFESLKRELAVQSLGEDNKTWAEDIAKRTCILRMLAQTPGVSVRTSVEDGHLCYTIAVLGRKGSAEASHFAEWLYDTSRRLLQQVYVANSDEHSLTKLLGSLELIKQGSRWGYRPLELLALVIQWLRGLGYIHADSNLIPFAIETYLKDTRDLDTSDQRSLDYQVQQELIESNRFRELSMFALFTLAEIGEEQRARELAQTYFEVKDSVELTDLLLANLSEEHHLVRVMRGDALREEIGRLNKEQKQVVTAQVNRSLIVYAGPGSGKTHTLLLRLAYLVHEEQIAPSRILVLAYNNAVVTEIRHRLRELFRRLGYASYINGLSVYTFHGFVRALVGRQISSLSEQETLQFLGKCCYLQVTQPGDYAKLTRRDKGTVNPDGTRRLPVSTFIAYFNYLCEQGRAPLELSNYRYILVDEFQDITEERYRMLRHIANGDGKYLTIIGDDDQSIYGYEREREIDAGLLDSQGDRAKVVGASWWFERFEEEYKASRIILKSNYRSLPQMLVTALDWISRNESHVKKYKQDVRSERRVPERWSLRDRYYEVIEGEQVDWKEVVRRLQSEQSTQGSGYREIALLFRYHSQAYRAYQTLREDAALGGMLRLHDRGRHFTSIREIHLVLQRWEQRASEQIDEIKPFEDIQEVAQECGLSIDTDNLSLLNMLAREFLLTAPPHSTYADLIQAVQDFEHSGNISKLMQAYWDKVGGQERKTRIILTTFHQAKGLEFDAVVVAPIERLIRNNEPQNEGSLEEEANEPEELRRIVYVGLTRARDRLVWIRGDIEQQLLAGRLTAQPMQEPLVTFKWSDPSTIFLSYCANDRLAAMSRMTAVSLQDYIRQEVRRYDPLKLVPLNNQLYLQHRDIFVARIAGRWCDKIFRLPNYRPHLYVSDVLWKEYDENEELEREYVSESIKKRGGYYYVSVFGYVEPA
ncbi:MAG: UvrD-helicase domain-containing protein [Candidatus Caldarchaeum sp.]